jgi:hypothetical protein
MSVTVFNDEQNQYEGIALVSIIATENAYTNKCLDL